MQKLKNAKTYLRNLKSPKSQIYRLRQPPIIGFQQVQIQPMKVSTRNG